MERDKPISSSKRQKTIREETTEFDSQNKVKVELVDEAISSQLSEDQIPELNQTKCLKQEMKIKTENFGNYVDTDLQASSQVNKLIENNIQICNSDMKWMEQSENKSEFHMESTRKKDYCNSIFPVSYNKINCESFLHANISTNCDNAVSEPKSNLHKCTICGRFYSGKDSLKTHVLSVHKKAKPFKCLECNFICSQKGNLSKHIKSVHEKWKPFMCAECDQTFSRKAHLSLHIKTVHENFFEHLSLHLKPVHINNQNM